MEFSVVLSDQAKEDIAGIYDYILNVLKSEINAESVLNRLYSAIDELSYIQMGPGILWVYIIFL